MISFVRTSTEAELEQCLTIRREVFIVEQDVDEAIEMDGCEDKCTHYLMLNGARAVGTARIWPKAETAKIQRVAVVKDHRGTGAGLALMRFVMKDAAGQGFTRALLGAQVYAIPFYEKLGFRAFGPVYLDAAIEHRDMARDLP